MVVSDLDGTLIHRGSPILKQTAASSRKLVESGTLFTLASGRMPGSLVPFAHQLGTNAPLICYGGSLIHDPATDSDLYQQSIPIQVSMNVLDEAKRRNLAANIYRRDDLLVESLDPLSPAYESWKRSGARPVGDLTKFLDLSPLHLAIVCEEHQRRALTLELRSMFAGQAHVSSGHPNLIEFNHMEVNKGRALAWLSNRMNIAQSQILVIGDDLNDLEMLMWAGVALAMPASPPELLSIADEIVPEGADVVSHVIERYGLLV